MFSTFPIRNPTIFRDQAAAIVHPRNAEKRERGRPALSALEIPRGQPGGGGVTLAREGPRGQMDQDRGGNRPACLNGHLACV